MPHYPKKKFGQHFLHDQEVIDKIVSAANVKPTDNLLEIGPGLGALTTKLLPLVNKLIAIELDRDIIPRLKQNCHNYLDRLHIEQQDVLRFDFSNLAIKNNLRLIGNLPYNISTPLLFHLMKFAPQIKDMHFMLQLEVAKRLAAKPSCEHPEFTDNVNAEHKQHRQQCIKPKCEGSVKDYGRLSVMSQYTWHTELLFTVAPHSFTPPPQVESAIVRMTPVSTRQVTALDYQTFTEVVRTAFNQRRKTLHNCLKNYVTSAELQSLNIDPNSRPEQISLDNFVKISNILYAKK